MFLDSSSIGRWATQHQRCIDWALGLMYLHALHRTDELNTLDAFLRGRYLGKNDKHLK
jgi:hypothetical protein